MPPQNIFYADTSSQAWGETLDSEGTQDSAWSDIPASIAGRFQVGRQLGAGGMGRVFRALDLELDEEVALKVLHGAAGVLSSASREQLRREVKATRRVVSPHVVRTYECGTAEGFPWFSMELIEGQSLAQHLRDTGKLSSREIVPLAAAICRGLSAAHAAGVVHRDLKPGNVMLGENRIAICDFGLAHMDWQQNQTRSVAGTPAYIAPEQLAGGQITPATDLFALGVILYELATGELPWVGNSPMAVATARLTQQPRDPRELAGELPTSLTQLILHCLHTQPAQRPRSADAVAEQLTALHAPNPRVTAVEPYAAPLTRSGVALQRLVVLPFAQLGTPSDLALGLAEDITGALLPHKRLRTVAARVARAFADEQRDPAEIGRSLSVDFVVDGSVRQTREGVRVQVAMTSCSDGEVRWSATLDCDATRAQDVHDEIAHAIARELFADADRVSTTPDVTDPIALQEYSAGRRCYQAALASFSPEQMVESVGHFERAAALAPTDPLIAAGHALAVCGQLAVAAATPAGMLQRAQSLAARAVELAPNSGDAWLAHGAAEVHAGQPVTAAVALRRAIGLSPSLPEPRVQMAALLADAGWLTQARQQLEVALELGGDPTSILGELLRVAVLQGDTSALARWQAEFTARSLPPFAAWRGIYAGALALDDTRLLFHVWQEMEAARAPLPPFVEALHVVLGSVLKQSSRDAHLALLPQIATNDGATPQRRCRSYLLWMAAQEDDAQQDWLLEMVGKAIDSGLCNVAWMQHATVAKRLADSPEFRQQQSVVARRAERIIDAYCLETQPPRPDSQRL